MNKCPNCSNETCTRERLPSSNEDEKTLYILNCDKCNHLLYIHSGFNSEILYKSESRINEEERLMHKKIDMKDLVGKHKLSGVEFVTGKEISYKYKDSQVMLFVLDNITYAAIEDPYDGYRSMLDEIVILEKGCIAINNTFNPIDVFIKVLDDDHYTLLKIIDSVTKMDVIKVGTENEDDYYPLCVLKFFPENMVINQKKNQKKVVRKPIPKQAVIRISEYPFLFITVTNKKGHYIVTNECPEYGTLEKTADNKYKLFVNDEYDKNDVAEYIAYLLGGEIIREV